MDERAAIELGGDLNRQLELPPGTFHDVGLGNGADEIAAERNERLHAAVAHGFAGFDRVEATLARRVKAELLSEWSSGTSSGFSVMPTVRWPWTFECPRTGKMPAPGLPMLPRISSKLLSIWIASTPDRCCVRPMP